MFFSRLCLFLLSRRWFRKVFIRLYLWVCAALLNLTKLEAPFALILSSLPWLSCTLNPLLLWPSCTRTSIGGFILKPGSIVGHCDLSPLHFNAMTSPNSSSAPTSANIFLNTTCKMTSQRQQDSNLTLHLTLHHPSQLRELRFRPWGSQGAVAGGTCRGQAVG